MARLMGTIDKINWFYQKDLFIKLVMQVQRRSHFWEGAKLGD